MNEKAYSYRKLWKKPIMIHRIFKGEHALIFSRGLELRQIIVAILIFGILFLFHNVLAFIPKAFMLALYVGIPWLLAGHIVKSNVDGKRIDRYLKGYIHSVRNRKIVYSSFEPVHKKELKKFSYEKFER
jgi:hypothetical protein